MEMLDALAAVNMHVMVAMPHVLNNSVDVNASTWPAFEKELTGNMSMVMHHPALAGCAASTACKRSSILNCFMLRVTGTTSATTAPRAASACSATAASSSISCDDTTRII